MRNWFILVLAGLSFAACKKEVNLLPEDQLKADIEKMENYLQDNNLLSKAQEHPSGIYYFIDSVGPGANPAISDEVSVRYKGYLLNGSVFDQTQGNDSISFKLQNLIEGWRIAIPLLKEGGHGTFLLPSYLGYGNFPPPGSIIGRNEVLIFDIELVDIK